jgi:Carboxypeptidase regulatory-like domain/TonB-dependent Receptor Plug Domain
MSPRQRTTLLWVLAILVLSQLPGKLYGQAASTGAILGTVVDSSGAVVPDAEVTITNVSTGGTQTVRTNSMGLYDLEGLTAAGTPYNVSIKKTGFKVFVSEGLVLHPSERVSLNATLEVGAASNEVTVEASAVHVETTSGESAGTIGGEEVTELQLNGRDFRGLALLVPGVNSTAITGSPVGGGTALNGGGLTGESPISVNGMGREMNNFTTDGAYNNNTGNMINLNITQPVESIAEFRILKDNYTAKYGTAGGAEIMVATRSGTQQFHGVAYDFLRNDKLDARNFFSPTRSILKQNIFGGSLGGPVFIPGHYNKDKNKTFFFTNIELRRRNVGVVARGAMIPEAMRNGDFTNDPKLPTGGLKLDQSSTALLNQIHPGMNCLPDATHLNPACFDPNAVALMNTFWPLPNNPAGGFNNYINTGTETFDAEDYTFRVDHNFNEKIRLLARSSYENARDNPPFLAWGNNPAPTSQQKITTIGWNNLMQLTTAFTPTTINQFSWTQTDDKPHLEVANIFVSNVKPPLTIQLPYGNVDRSKRVPQITLSNGWAGISDAGLPQYASDGEQVLSEDFTKVIGAHNIQAGTMFIWGIKRQDNFSNPEGAYQFTGVHTGDPVADYLLGLDASLQQNNTRLRGYFRYHQSESYVQDDWRVTSRLTLNLGVRVVYFSSDKMEGNGFSDFDPKLYSPSQASVVHPDGTLAVNAAGQPITSSGALANLQNGLVFPGKNGVPTGIFTTSPHAAPRLGFAWDVFGNGRTALRGGYGVGYGRIPFAIYNSDLGNYPFQLGTTLLNGTLTNPTLGTPSALTSQSLGTVGPPGAEYSPVKIQTYSLTIERQVLQNGVLQLAYVGSHGTNIPGSYDRNFPLPVAGPSIVNSACLQPGQTIPAGGFGFDPCLNSGVVSKDYTRPYVGWSALNGSANSAAQYNGVSNYNSLQAGFNYRVASQLTLTAAYTFGKSLTDVANRAFDARQTGAVAQNPRNYGVEYGPPGYDRTHIFTSGYVWNLPFLKGSKGFTSKVLGNWTFSGITVIESGFAFAPGLSTSNAGLAIRPNCNGTLSGPKTVAQWFNTGAFTASAFGEFGNCGNGIIRGPGENTWNWAFYKTFPFTERVNLEFRSEFFNIWNHANFAGVSTKLGAGDFGQVTSALDPRQIEFALKLRF